MSERMRDEDLERTLAEVGAGLDYPRSTAVAASVRERIARPRSRWAALLGRPFAPAALTLALILILTAFALPDVRSAAQQFLHLRGIDIFPIPSAPAAATGAPLPLTGERVSLDEARRRVHFTIRVPSATELGVPDDVFVETSGTAERVTLVYRQRAAIPPSREAGVAALIGEFRGSLDEILLGKATGPGTKIEAISINGGRGFWLEGEPHLFFYRDANGDVRQDTLRLAGNTLVWEQGGVTMRLEAQVSKDQALKIAATFR
jgi:hypothetical protein